MSAKSTPRANSSSKDKPKATLTQQPITNKDVGNTKVKATAEQMRIAQIIADKTDHAEDGKLKIIKQVQEMTHKSQDEVVIVLHDCDFDMNRAINMLLEGQTDQSEWHETGKKKKRVQQGNNHSPDIPEIKTDFKSERREKSSDRDRGEGGGFKERSESSSRGRRNDAIPRFQRGGKSWRGKENEENDRNRTDSNDRGRGRGRGGRGRGRGRGGNRGNRGAGTDRPDRGERSERMGATFDNGPQIDTWTNDQAETKKESKWMETGIEDWDNDTWTGNLNETKVFTASNNLDAGSIQQDNGPINASLNSMSNTMTNSITNSLSNSLTNSLSVNLNSITNEPFSQPNSISQSLDLGPILQPKVPGSMLENDMNGSQTSDSLSRYTKQATESIKNIVGIGNNTSSMTASQAPHTSTNLMSTSSLSLMSTSSLAPGIMVSAQQPISVSQSAVTAQRSKPLRSKLPPPSKIPASAVEMPGHMATSNMDVQFGFGDPSGLSFGSDSTSGLSFVNSVSSNASVMNNHIPARSKTPEPTTTMSALLASITPPKSAPDQANMRSAAYPGSASATPTKDYTQSPIKSGIGAPDLIPFPAAQNDRKTSPMMTSQRSQPGVLNSSDPGGYSSSYPSAAYKAPPPAQSTASSFTHSASSLTTPQSGLQQRQQQPYQSSRTPYQSSGYQSSSFQNQSGYSSGQNQSSSLYQTNNQAGYGSQNTSYQREGHSNSSYSSNSAGPSFPVTQNQSSSYNTSPSSGSGYQVSQPSAVFQSGQGSFNSNQQPGSSSASSSFPVTPSGGSSNYPQHGQSAIVNFAANQSPSSSYTGGQYQSGHSVVNSYHTSAANSGSTYPARDSNQTQSANNPSYGLAYGTNSLNTNKLGDTLSKMNVKDNSLDSNVQGTSYEHSSQSAAAVSLASSSTTAATASGSPVGSVNSVSSGLGLTTSNVSPTSTLSSSSTKISSSLTAGPSKAPPNLPPGVPLMGHNFIMGQHGMAPYFGLPTQQPMYSYEELQLLQQRVPLAGYYDTGSLPFQPPSSMAANRDQNVNNTVPYSGNEGKMGRVDVQSPVQQASQVVASQPPQSAHQQTYINPATLPPGYGYYYPGGMLPGSFQYPAPFLTVPPVTNATHGSTSAANAQFQQKPGTGGYGTHAAYGTTYDDLSQAQDFGKTGYGAVSHQNKGVAAGTMKAIVTTAASDISASSYGKSHTQVGLSFDKQGFHAGTPPPFNMAMQTGTQAGPMAATNPYAQFVPMMTHHSQMMHQLQQDASGGSSRASQQAVGQAKTTNKNFSTAYWSN